MHYQFLKDKELSKHKVSDPETLAIIFKKIMLKESRDQEHFILVGFTSQNFFYRHHCLFSGGIDSSIVEIPILFRRLLSWQVIKFAVAHNHPSEEVKPSDEDKKTNAKIGEASNILGFDFLDHLILGDKKFYSFSANKTYSFKSKKL